MSESISARDKSMPKKHALHKARALMRDLEDYAQKACFPLQVSRSCLQKVAAPVRPASEHVAMYTYPKGRCAPATRWTDFAWMPMQVAVSLPQIKLLLSCAYHVQQSRTVPKCLTAQGSKYKLN